DIPAVKITYNIQSAAAGGAQGRDMAYILPPIPMRVLSLVPKLAADIRDAPHQTFADIEARRFRAMWETVAAGLCFGLAAVLVGLALVRTVGRYRRDRPTVARPVPARAILNGCL